ncbi:PREDICTED: serine/threonine-protein kinase PDIK1L-like [Branchiostoma belcheri]|uniref:Serine/threonine-protein kinase PDIK1L-like n=1 Tax=Branchiostoma belcheri TaxID=7741 RepID=A0A6P4XQL1_BRABE|nr:PREDICTED: serine/threonine-protein kinase PDIK1L-like [Branchiostoma belcheri]
MRLGKYEVGRLLGEGAFGKVYKGKDVNTGGVVAIKRLKIENVRQLESAKNELIPLLALFNKSHQHIVKCFQTELMHGSLWLVLEYCSVGTLNDFLLSKPGMSVSAKIGLMREIADAVNFLHSNHIVHRDLKPDNILLSGSRDNPVVKVADFGLAKVCGVVGSLSEYYMNSHCGTELFLAPEVFTAQDYKMYCDIFSMGVIFVSMIDMQQVGKTVVAYIKGRMGAVVPIGRALLNNPPPNLSAHFLTSLNDGSFKKLCLSMLSANYRNRPKAVDLLACLNLIGHSSQRPTSGRPDSGQRNRRRMVSPVAMMGGAGVGGLVGGPVGAMGMPVGAVGVVGAPGAMIGGPVGAMGMAGAPVGAMGMVGAPAVGAVGLVGAPVGAVGMIGPGAVVNGGMIGGPAGAMVNGGWVMGMWP